MKMTSEKRNKRGEQWGQRSLRSAVLESASRNMHECLPDVKQFLSRWNF